MRDVADVVDAVLLRELERVAGMIRPTVSPIDFGEIRLAAGCSAETAPCLAALASALDVEAIVLRQLDHARDGRARITLLHHARVSAAAPARVTYSSADPDALVDHVPQLVRRLFGVPDAPRAEGDGPSVGAATWLSLGAGVVLVTIASVLSFMAADAQREYVSIHVQTRDDAERVLDVLSDAEDRALAANLLFVVGGAALGVGATLLVLDLSGDRGQADGETRSLGVVPLQDGAVVLLGGSVGGT